MEANRRPRQHDIHCRPGTTAADFPIRQMGLAVSLSGFMNIRLLASLALASCVSVCSAGDYLVAIGKSSAGDDGWTKAAKALAAKHQGEVATWDETEAGLLALLRKENPRYLAIIGKPETFDAPIVRGINRATRMADPDVWTDCQWGLITGQTPADAMKVISATKPLVVKRALCTTGIELGQMDSGLVLSDGASGKFTRKLSGQAPVEQDWDAKANPAGTVELFAEAWNKDKPQVLVTSSHATQFNLEMPFGIGLIASHGGKFHVVTKAQRNDFARFLGGAMFKGNVADLGKWIDSIKAPVLGGSEDDKVWVAAGNCLIGDARKTSESMVVSAISNGGVRQFLGYVVPTWYGKNGWGASGLWQSSHGRLSLSEAFFLNTQAVIDASATGCPGAELVNFDSDDIEHGMKQDRGFLDGLQKLQNDGKLTKENSKDVLGMIHDRDVVALWGDPCWIARFGSEADGPAIAESWQDDKNSLTLTLEAKRAFTGDYPLWLPRRVTKPVAEISGDAKPDAIVAKDFLYLRKLDLKPGQKMKITIKQKD